MPKTILVEKIATKTYIKYFWNWFLSNFILLVFVISTWRKFISKFENELKNKKLGLFICCGAEGDEALKELNENYPKELLDIAVAKDYFGGEIKLSKMPKLIQFIVKKMAKTDIDKDMLLPDHIKNFALEMNKA